MLRLLRLRLYQGEVNVLSVPMGRVAHLMLFVKKLSLSLLVMAKSFLETVLKRMATVVCQKIRKVFFRGQTFLTFVMAKTLM